MEVIRKKGIKKWRIVGHNKPVFYVIVAIIIILLGIMVYLIFNGNKTNGLDEKNNSQMANPASVYCINNNGALEIKTDANGGQYGLCVFEDGSSCEEWEYFRGNCSAGQSANECSQDSDCVPASCCHASSCVLKENAPVCGGRVCSQECKLGSLDCGQGTCVCANGKCGASLVS